MTEFQSYVLIAAALVSVVSLVIFVIGWERKQARMRENRVWPPLVVPPLPVRQHVMQREKRHAQDSKTDWRNRVRALSSRLSLRLRSV